MEIIFQFENGYRIEDLPDNLQNLVRHHAFKPHLIVGDMTQEETDELKNTGMISRIDAFENIEPRAYELTNVERIPSTSYSSFTSDVGSWALAEISSKTNRLRDLTTPSVVCDFGSLGKGVDLIEFELGSGVAVSDHPEWISEETGESRFVEYDWSQHGSSFVQPSDYYSSSRASHDSTHGTSSLSVAAGKLYGPAKEATLYTIGSHSSSVTGLWTTTEALELVKRFHLSKTSSRPTVLAYNHTTGAYLYPMTYDAVEYQGSMYDVDLTTSAGRYEAHLKYKIPLNINSSSVDLIQSYEHTKSTHELSRMLNELVELGVTVVNAAGNESQYLSYPGSVNWDNALIESATGKRLHYNRSIGSGAPGVLVVGATDSQQTSQGKYKQASFSNRGERIDLYAPGIAVPSASISTGVSYPLNDSYYSDMFGGTSSACPITAGVAACVAGVHPDVGSVASIVKGAAEIDRVDPGPDDVTDLTNTHGATTKFLVHPYGSR